MLRPRTLVLGLALVGLIALAYAKAVSGGFLWDDDAHITANPTIVGPLGLKEIWTTGRANYFPLVLTNFWLQHAAWGLNAAGYHVVTLVCHMAAALLLWRVLAALRVPGAWEGAALWALHPVQVESVAWICELKNTQSAVFFLAAVLFWLRSGAVDSPARRRQYALALLCALAALLSKPSTVMLPVALGLVVWWQRGRLTRRDAALLAPFFALSALASGWTIWEQAYRQHASGGEWALTLVDRFTVAGRAVWFYAFKLVWPGDLIFIYPRWEVGAWSWAGVAAMVGVVAMAGWLWLQRDRWRGGFCCAVFFVALLFPVLGFFNVYFFRFSFVSDHFQYLASMGPLALAGAALSHFPAGMRKIATGAAIGALSLLTVAQCGEYRDSETLWRSTVARNPAAWMAWDNLGEILTHRGRRPEAVECYRRALALNPRDADAYHNLGFEAIAAHDFPEAIRLFQHALEFKPGDARTHNGLGLALWLTGRRAEALARYETAVSLVPDFALARRNLALAFVQLGRPADAVAHYEWLLAAEPANLERRRDLADTLCDAGRWTQAIPHYEVALRQAPGEADIHARLGIALAQTGRKADGVVELQRAAQLDPKDANIQRNLGFVLRDLGRLGEAADHLSQAAALEAGRR